MSADSIDAIELSDKKDCFFPKNVYVYAPWIDVIGSKGAGKSCLMQRIIENEYNPSAGRVHLSEIKKELHPGLLRFRDNPKEKTDDSNAICYTDIVLCCYDVTDQNSFDYISDKFDEIRKKINSSRPVRFIIAATKCDVVESERMIRLEQGETFANSKGAGYIETSAKTGKGCKELIDIFLPFRKPYLKEVKEVEEAEERMKVGKKPSCCIII